MAKLTGNSNINIGADLTSQVYGGGNIALTQGNTNININSGTHTKAIYGGGNVGQIQGNTIVNINGGTQETVYGGGNQATVTTSSVNINGGTNNNVFAGGNQAKVTNTTVNILGGINTDVYGGGNSADVEITNSYVKGGNTKALYGGSNQTGTVNNSNIETTNGTVDTIYGGNNIGGTTFVNLFGGGGLTITFGYSFVRVLIWTLVWAVFATFTTYIGGILLSILINHKRVKGKKMWRTLFMVTIAVPQFVSLLLVRNFFANGGIVNTICANIGLTEFLRETECYNTYTF